jgi:hypothetical protein
MIMIVDERPDAGRDDHVDLKFRNAVLFVC